MARTRARRGPRRPASVRGDDTLVTALSIVVIGLAVLLIVAILLQSGRAAGLSGSITGAGESFFGKKKGLDDFLSRMTVVLVTLFLIAALVTAYFQRVG